MLKEMTVFVGEEKLQVMMQAGFFDFKSPVNSIHKHQYTELHIIVGGEEELFVDGNVYSLSSGDMIVIPQKKMHYVSFSTEKTAKIAFQITKNVREISVILIGLDICNLIRNGINSYVASGGDPHLSSLLSLVCSFIPEIKAINPNPISNRGFIINEFLTSRYNCEISISDMAAELGVSEKQASRLVKKYTGKTFRDEISARRIEAARYLMLSSSMNLEQIAQKVGYKSYSGFWKAFNKKESSHLQNIGKTK